MVKPRLLQEAEDVEDAVVGPEDELEERFLKTMLLAMLVTAVADPNAFINNAANKDIETDDTTPNNSSEVEAPSVLMTKDELLEKLKELYGEEVFKYLTIQNDYREGIDFQSEIRLDSSYIYREQGCIDFLAQGAALITVSRSFRKHPNRLHFENFVPLLAKQLQTCATWQDEEVINGKRPPNPYETLQKYAYDAYLEYEELASSDSEKTPLTLDEKSKLARSIVYAIAVLKDPSNPALIGKLAKNASQTVGIVSSKYKKFYGTLCLIALTAIIIYSVVAIPWTGGLSLALGLTLGAGLILAGTSAGLFYSAKEKSMAKKISSLGKALENYQNPRDTNLKKGR